MAEKTTSHTDAVGNVGVPFPADSDVVDGGVLERVRFAAGDPVSEDDETEGMDVEDEMPTTLTQRQRVDVATARDAIHRAAAGYGDVDLPRVAAMLDRVLRDGCPHDPVGWVTVGAGRAQITCPACGVSWHADPD